LYAALTVLEPTEPIDCNRFRKSYVFVVVIRLVEFCLNVTVLTSGGFARAGTRRWRRPKGENQEKYPLTPARPSGNIAPVNGNLNIRLLLSKALLRRRAAVGY
jgi:hypothetical protein